MPMRPMKPMRPMMQAKHTLGLIFFPAFDWAISPTHPEREERLLYTQDQIFEEGLADVEGIHVLNPDVASYQDVYRVHFPYPSAEARVTSSHLISAGGFIRALEAVEEGQVDKAFAIVRPPGHHAHRVVYGDRGFCIINVEAVGLEHLRVQKPNLRVAIVDTDCHHGDGTQDIYWNDPNTLYISFHQDGRTLYPGTGFIDEAGGPGAFGLNVNIPLPPNTGDEGFLYVLDRVVLPILEEYKPDLIINSAGQDNHYSDPLTNMNFSAQGYAELNHRLNPDVAILEGGYSIQSALPYVNTGIVAAMAGLDYSQIKEPDYDLGRWKQSRSITRQIEKICDEVLDQWQHRESLAAKRFAGLSWVQRKKQIYYDTDDILEQQSNFYRVCPSCPGLTYLESVSTTGGRIFAVQIPLHACPSCQEEGLALFEEAVEKKTYKRSYLQDRVHETYLQK